LVKDEFDVSFSYSYMTRFLRIKFNAKFSKPRPHDYRQSNYYKQTLFLKLYTLFKNFKLKYDINTGNIMNLDTNNPFLIFSFDESANQFTTNNIRVWSLTKPQIVKDTNHYKCNVAGAYSLTEEGNDDLIFLEDSKKETIVKCLDSLKKVNPVGDILLLIDNFPSHVSNFFKDYAKSIGISLCFLPPYSPQLQPEEGIWWDVKRDVSQFKMDQIEEYKYLKKDEKEEILKDTVKNSFYNHVKSKNRWNKILNNFIKPIIKSLNPLENLNWEVQKIY
jgi:transposase